MIDRTCVEKMSGPEGAECRIYEVKLAVGSTNVVHCITVSHDKLSADSSSCPVPQHLIVKSGEADRPAVAERVQIVNDADSDSDTELLGKQSSLIKIKGDDLEHSIKCNRFFF